MNGIIIINKPQGITSHDVVKEIRKLFPNIKAGHSGTLDPMATGVLPVCLGRATRIVEYIIELPKTYRASIALGKTTETEDATGEPVAYAEVPALNLEEIEAVLSKFRGKIKQLPPHYSAVKHLGKPLYHWARKGEEVPRKMRTVEIYSLKLLKYNRIKEPSLEVEVKCSRGTYIRTLAADIGKEIGCGAHLSSLLRSSVGPYRLENALTPGQLKNQATLNQPEKFLLKLDSALGHLPVLTLDEQKMTDLKHGKLVDLDQQDRKEKIDCGEPFRVYDCNGLFRAIASIVDTEENGLKIKTVKYLSS